MEAEEFQVHSQQSGFPQGAELGVSGRVDTHGINLLRSQLKCWQGHAQPMSRAHQHDDLEVNYVTVAPLKYLFGGTPVEVHPGQMSLFWGAISHRLIDCPENRDAYVCWIHVPLHLALNWGLPESVVTQILCGEPVVLTLADRRRTDQSDFAQWSSDLACGAAELRSVALLEIQALIRRLVHQAPASHQHLHGWTNSNDAMRHAAAMARFAATHFREPIAAADIAAAVHLHPNYAMTLFRRVVGTTLATYLTQCRIAEAQRLLITTHDTISDIAHAAGFGSQSGFYATFNRVCQQSPGTYRRKYRSLDLSTQPQSR